MARTRKTARLSRRRSSLSRALTSCLRKLLRDHPNLSSSKPINSALTQLTQKQSKLAHLLTIKRIKPMAWLNSQLKFVEMAVTMARALTTKRKRQLVKNYKARIANLRAMTKMKRLTARVIVSMQRVVKKAKVVVWVFSAWVRKK